MENVILQKRSGIANAVPTVAELEPGEIALNIVDGAAYIHTSDDTVDNLLNYLVADGGEIIP